MRVYRVQTSDGRGPFRRGFTNLWLADRPQAEFDALAGWMELPDAVRAYQRSLGERFILRRYFGSACVTVEALRRWFTPPEYAILRTHGFGAYAIDGATVVWKNDVQCLIYTKTPFHHGRRFDLYGDALHE